MKRFILTALLVAASFVPAFAGVKVIKTLPNGDQIVRIKTVGVFVPSTTTICKLTKDGELLPLNAAASSGVLGQVAAPAATASAAYLHRPDTTSVSQSGGNASGGNSTSTSGATAAGGNANANGGAGGAGGNGGNGGDGGSGQHVPPGHVNNPSNNH